MNTLLIEKINERLVVLETEKEHLKREIRDIESKKDDLDYTLYCQTFMILSTKLVETKSKMAELNVVINIIQKS
jgi:hypothetical protein